MSQPRKFTTLLHLDPASLRGLSAWDCAFLACIPSLAVGVPGLCWAVEKLAAGLCGW